jgi:uncharacterized protein (TIGR00661 family)
MAKLFFSLSGEGRGHATRVRAVVEQLRDQNEILIYAPGEAFNFLKPIYQGTDIRVQRVAGLRFHYCESRRLNFPKTARQALGYLKRLPSLVSMLKRAVCEHQPDLIISDFEPALPRAARQLGVPYISIDHQNFLTTYDLRSLPLFLRLHAAYMGLIVRAYCRHQVHRVVSSFYFPPLKPGLKNVTQVGVMLRREIIDAEPENQGHLVAYWRRFAGQNVLQALESCGREVRIYGLGRQSSRGNLRFLPIDEQRFIEDLASCDALVSTAGNQLVGEALHLGKPVFGMPEARNYEQYINGHFLKQDGGGDSVELEKLDAIRLKSFLNQLDEYRSRIDRQRINGLPRTVHVIRRFIDNPHWLTRPEMQPEFNPSA